MSLPQTPESKLNKLDVVQWIAAAPYAELVAALAHGLAQRSDLPLGDPSIDYVVGLALAVREESSWEVSLVARTNDAAYSGCPPTGEPWCQFGTCGSCNLEVVGHLKNLICPYCNSRVFLT